MSASNASPKKRGAWKPAFLSHLAQSGMVTEACKSSGIDRSTAYRARQQDETFALAWADVEERSTEELEREANRRAVDGSDTLLIFLLKSRRPEKYRENVKIEHAGSVQQDFTGSTIEELRERARALLDG